MRPIANYTRSLPVLATVLGIPALTALAMDKVRIETRVDAAVLQYGVQGRGVIIADRTRNARFQRAASTFVSTSGSPCVPPAIHRQ